MRERGPRRARPVRRRPAREWFALAATAGLLLAGCAKREPPTGGPLDLEPPRLISSTPDSGAAGVPRAARLSVTFSENMEPRSTGDCLALAPRIDIRQKRWSGRTVSLVLAESLRANRTYTLFLGAGARDAHGNNLVEQRAVVFSTAPVFPPGVIEGQIEARGFPVAGTYLWCYEAGGNRVPDSTARDFDDVGLTDKLGHFRVTGLPVPGRYRLWAFADLNANRSFEPQTDVLAAVDTVFNLTADRPSASGLSLSVVNPRAPGRVRGAVLDSLNDSLGVVRIMVSAPPDTVRVLQFDVDAQGAFDFRLTAGTYRVRAYRDLDRNHGWQPDREPASDALTVVVPAAGDVLGVRPVLRRAKGRP
jgi:hypothetical protein